MAETLIMSFPGDPISKVLKLSRKEFLDICPRTPITIATPDTIEIFPLSPDYIACDFCNADPEDVIYFNQRKAICESCAKETWLPYCKKE